MLSFLTFNEKRKQTGVMKCLSFYVQSFKTSNAWQFFNDILTAEVLMTMLLAVTEQENFPSLQSNQVNNWRPNFLKEINQSLLLS